MIHQFDVETDKSVQITISVDGKMEVLRLQSNGGFSCSLHLHDLSEHDMLSLENFESGSL